MKKKKILLCWGTRPEALKMAPLALSLRPHRRLKPIILLTGQHKHMARQVMRLFGLKADYDLRVMKRNQTLSYLSSAILSRMDRILQRIRPDCVLVQGDTTTAFLVALAAFYRKIPVGHVEAGLRTDDKYQPFPEEINRRMITPIADFHFAPTRIAVNRLLSEGVEARNIAMTGNPIIDALVLMRDQLGRRRRPPLILPKNRKIILVTAHRRESFGRPLTKICHALKQLARLTPECEIYYPVHLNPNVQDTVQKQLGGQAHIHLIRPLAYDQLVYLMSRADLILTDSGGIQEEAPSFGKAILVLRNVTERPEGVKAGFSKVVGQEPSRIVPEAMHILRDPSRATRLSKIPNPYGDGKAANRVIQFLEKRLEIR
jgi:UDP-N-acetylglucosamine 2-epimerase (non-hydrolysing)